MLASKDLHHDGRLFGTDPEPLVAIVAEAPPPEEDKDEVADDVELSTRQSQSHQLSGLAGHVKVPLNKFLAL
eukprot:1858278-Amphidinium_carterae.1